jgi:peptide/nickel transport system substrate-binding protein
MKRRSHWFLLGAIGLVALMVASAAVAGSNATPRRGGTVIYGLDQEPRILNGYLTEGNLFATSEATEPLLDGGMEYNNRGVLVPVLIAGQPKLVKKSPMTIRFTYKKNARWSAGNRRPHVTGNDFLFTWQTIMTKDWDITSREGWEDISRVRVSGKGKKTVTITFRKPYAAWKPLVATSPLPAFALRGANFNQVWRNDFFVPGSTTSVSSGPFLFERWQRGSQLVLRRDPAYWGKKANLDRIVFRVVQDTNTQFQAIRSGEISVLRPQPQLQIADARQNSRLRVQSGPEFAWEHIDIQRGAKGHPALKQAYVRQALIRGINRPAIANALYRTIAPGLPVLQSVIFKPFEKEYVPHWRKWSYSRSASEQLLRRARCTKGDDGIYSCPQVGKLSFRFTSTAGNQLRELAFEIIQSQLKAVGIEVKSAFGPARTVFGTVLPSKDWDLFMFTWIGSPTSPITDEAIHGCNGDQNYMDYCNQRVHRLLVRAQTELNDKRRANLLNQADALMANDIVQIPLFARPGFLIHERRIQGILRNPTQQTSLWNVNNWWSTTR